MYRLLENIPASPEKQQVSGKSIRPRAARKGETGQDSLR
jgi:hypothetical protein